MKLLIDSLDFWIRFISNMKDEEVEKMKETEEKAVRDFHPPQSDDMHKVNPFPPSCH